MDNTSDFNGSEFQPDDTNVTDRTEVKDSPVRQYPWNADHTNVMNLANIDHADSRLEESTSHADGAILAGFSFPSPNASHNISVMSTSSIFMGPPVAASTPAAKHASLLEPSDSDRGKRTLKRKGPMLSPIHGGSWRKPAKRKASTSDTNGHGGHELADPEDASTNQGEPDQTKFHTAEQAANAAKDLSVVLEEQPDTSLDYGDDKDAE